MPDRQPAGYHALTPGTRFVEILGVAVPLSALDGEARGSMFYQGDEGRLIRTREQTPRERCEASKSVFANRPAPAFAAADLDLWK